MTRDRRNPATPTTDHRRNMANTKLAGEEQINVDNEDLMEHFSSSYLMSPTNARNFSIDQHLLHTTDRPSIPHFRIFYPRTWDFSCSDLLDFLLRHLDGPPSPQRSSHPHPGRTLILQSHDPQQHQEQGRRPRGQVHHINRKLVQVR